MQFLSKSLSVFIGSRSTGIVRTVLNNVPESQLCSSSILSKRIGIHNDESGKKCESSLNLPEKPKKPPTTFISFLLSVRSQILRENPQISNKELMRYAAHLWKNADKETRTQIQVRYYSDLEKYLDEVQQYNSNLTEEQSIALKKLEAQKKENRIRRLIKEKMKSLEKPKRPLNSYSLYMTSKKEELKNIQAQDFVRKLAQDWKELPEDEKKKFRKQSKKLQIEYHEKLAKWKERVGSINISRLIKSGDIEMVNKILEQNSVEKKSSMDFKPKQEKS